MINKKKIEKYTQILIINILKLNDYILIIFYILIILEIKNSFFSY